MAKTTGIWGTEHGYNMNELFRLRGGVEEELSSLIFSVGIIIGKVSYLFIQLPDNNNDIFDKYDEQHLLK